MGKLVDHLIRFAACESQLYDKLKSIAYLIRFAACALWESRLLI